MEMFGERQVKLEKGTNRAKWKVVAMLWPCNERKCFPVRDYMAECGDLTITVESSNEALSKKERQQMARSLALIETCERRNRAVQMHWTWHANSSTKRKQTRRLDVANFDNSCNGGGVVVPTTPGQMKSYQ